MHNKYYKHCLLYKAVFKCNKSSASLESKVLFLFPFWLVLKKIGI